MDNMPVEIYPVAAVREMDRAAIEDHNIPGYSLMTRAGEATVRAAVSRFPAAKRWQVVCGAGNNGGDGYVIARLAVAAGHIVSVIALIDPESLTGDAAMAYSDFAAADGVVSVWSGELDPDAADGSAWPTLLEAALAEAERSTGTLDAPGVPLPD